MKPRFSTIVSLLTLFLSGCFFFYHPNKKDFRNQKIPTDLLGSWQLVTVNEKSTSCPITMTFQPEGKIETDFAKQYEGWFWILPDGRLVLHSGLNHKLHYDGYENCSVDPTTLAIELNFPEFRFEMKNDTLKLTTGGAKGILLKRK